MKCLDFILIHAFTLNENHQPNKIHKQILDYGLYLFNGGFGKEIIVAGKLDNKDRKYFEETNIPLSEIMKEYLTKNGIPFEKVHEESNGENTYDCTVNSFRNIILPRDWKSGIITSSAEHLPRIQVQTMKIMSHIGIDEKEMQLFYSGLSIRNSGESEEKIRRFVEHESKAIAYTLKKQN
ncbi:MAG TPA: YdcF family protein [Candidatus Nanoarchaeia archaeon]|nr:YdcF family protein [Candidatus Nanoarchaeia archaeon]